MSRVWIFGLVVVAACNPRRAEPVRAEQHAVAGAATTTTIYVTRHAEKAGSTVMDEDPSLSVRGAARARALAERLSGEHVTAIYVTQYVRTQETAQPLALALGITPRVMTATAVKRLVEDLLERHTGEHVLVIGHSNTVPEVVAALGVESPVSVDEREYGELFVVTRVAGQPATLTRERFGE